MLDKGRLGIAGEHFAVGRLALAGLDAAIVGGNTKDYDLLVGNPRTKRYFQVQVKATKEKTGGVRLGTQARRLFGSFYCWPMFKENHGVLHKNLRYLLVMFPKDENKPVRYFVIPDKVIARYVQEEHQAWKEEKRSKGSVEGEKGFRPSTQRMVRIYRKPPIKGNAHPKVPPIPSRRYENAWHFLGGKRESKTI